MPQSSVRFQQVMLVVHELERALGFYRDILGMEVEASHEAPADAYAYTAFEIDRKAKLRVATLNASGQPRAVALVEVKGATLRHCPDPKRAAVVLEVADFDYVCERAVAWGLIVHPENHVPAHDGRMGREAGIVDHDGNLVVVRSMASRAV